MEAPTGQLPASGLPKTLLDMLGVLLKENGLKSWQIYSEKYGLSVKLRFGQPQNGGQATGVDSNNKVSYAKKSPSQVRRDNKKATERRKTRSAAKQMAENDIEVPRYEATEAMMSPSYMHSYTPEPVNTSDLDKSDITESPMIDHSDSSHKHSTPVWQPVGHGQGHSPLAAKQVCFVYGSCHCGQSWVTLLCQIYPGQMY